MAGLVSLLRSIPLASHASRVLSLSGASPLLRLRPVVAAVRVGFSLRRSPVRSGFRCFSTRPTTSSLNDPSPNWSNRPPKETILLDGCDFEHWLVVVEPPDPSLTRDEIIDSYIKTLSEVLGSEEEARMSIYSVSTKHYFAFGCKVSEEISYKIKPLPKVRWVLPDSYLDVKNKDYGGEPFIDGKAVPYDPKYHEEWVRNNARAQERSRRNDRPRNFDRSRNFERRRENMQNFPNREAPVQNQDFPSQNSTQHTSQATPPVRDGATPNFQNQPPPNYQNQMSPNTTATASSLNDPSPNWSTSRDFEHWLVFVESPDPSDPSRTRDEIIDGFLLEEPPDPSLTRDEIIDIDSYIKSLAEGLGSEEEARILIYSVSTKHYCAFDCKVSKEISYKIKRLPKVRWVLPDSYLDVKNKDYGGEPFIDGKAVPYDPQQNFQNREAPPVQNQDFPSQNTTQHATPNFQNQSPPNYENQMSPNMTAIPNYQNQTPPNSTAVPNQHGGYIPNYQGGSRGYQGGPGGPGYQGDQGYQSGFPRSNIPGGGFGSNGSSPDYPGDNVTGSSPGYPRGNPAYQVNPGGYQGGSFATPPIYQGDSSARPGSYTGYQGGGPPPTAYPGGYQGGAPAYQGGSPVGRQVFYQPFQGQGVTSGYPPPNSRYQGGSQNNQQGGEGYQGGSPVYPGRDLPGRDQ